MSVAAAETSSDEARADPGVPSTLAGMIDNICNLFPVDMESSYLVGDSDVDRLLARHFGLKFIQIDNDDNVKNKLLLNFRDISNDYN